MRLLWTSLVIVCLYVGFLHAQTDFVTSFPELGISVVRGENFPENPVENTWFHDMHTLQVHVFSEGEWKGVGSGAYTEITPCHRGVMLRKATGVSIASSIGGSVLDCDGSYCSDSLFGFWNSDVVFFMDRRDSTRVLLIQIMGTCDYQVQQISLEGQDGFCVPEYFDNSYLYPCEELHTWGILGSNGQWLIAPQYDAPFQFVNGVAEVIFKGERRRINEKGE